MTSGRLARWAIILREYEYDLIHRKGTKNPADHLSRSFLEVENDESSENVEESSNSLFSMDILRYHALRNYLEGNKYPRDVDEEFRNKLKNQSRKYKLVDGKLFSYSKNYGLREVLHERNVQEKIEEIHNQEHTGINNTWIKVKRKFTGNGIFEMVKHVVSFCDRCQRFTGNPTRRHEFDPIKVTKPFEVLGIDAIGPINPISANGSRYILTAIDYVTKWPVLKAVENVQTETVVNFLIYDVIMNYGVPKKLISDRGSNFVSDTAVELYKFLGIDHHPTTSYRPQSNGQVERFNQLIKNVLSKICLFDKENWDLYLWKAMLTIRTMKHRVTGNSPSEMLYGFEITTPLTWTAPVTN
ncbi:Pro-Pol polyprotein [Smittium culicis]|uniref:Pro-Pol polyprotein n=1 Tax=Smittium culicis TaxID=133412 RepID=A0A1R1YEV1_9FUNG|nr:Pro-Pol polyprotein [Smittium culicis]